MRDRYAVTDADVGRERYLELLKQALTYALWEDPGVPLERVGYGGPVLRSLVRGLSRGLGAMRLGLVYRPAGRLAQLERGKGWPSQAHTMIGRARLDQLQDAVARVLAEGVPGDLIETGVWRGGACILMRGVLAAHGVRDRRVFVADSFAGLPPPDATRHPADRGDVHHKIGFLAVSREEVAEHFRRYGLLDDQVVFLEGWFRDTLPQAPIERLAVLRLDGDMYGSTRDALEPLYPRLSPGGYCIVDDYALPGCRAAVEDYRREHGITEPIERIDWTGAFWRKRA